MLVKLLLGFLVSLTERKKNVRNLCSRKITWLSVQVKNHVPLDLHTFVTVGFVYAVGWCVILLHLLNQSLLHWTVLWFPLRDATGSFSGFDYIATHTIFYHLKSPLCSSHLLPD